MCFYWQVNAHTQALNITTHVLKEGGCFVAKVDIPSIFYLSTSIAQRVYAPRSSAVKTLRCCTPSCACSFPPSPSPSRAAAARPPLVGSDVVWRGGYGEVCWCGVAWRGVLLCLWCGVVWCGVVWRGVAWRAAVLVVWCGVQV